MQNKPALLNTSIVTNYGSFTYRKIGLKEAKSLIAAGFDSYVGHQSTCDILTTVLGVTVPMNRASYKQQPGNVALVFKLNTRLGEGVVMTVAEIEAVGYEFGTIEMRAKEEENPKGYISCLLCKQNAVECDCV